MNQQKVQIASGGLRGEVNKTKNNNKSAQHPNQNYQQHNVQSPQLNTQSPYGQQTVPPPPFGQQTVPPPPFGQQTVPPPPFGQQTVPPPYFGQQTVPPPPFGQQTVPPPPFGQQTVPPPTFGQQTVPPPYFGQQTVPPPYGQQNQYQNFYNPTNQYQMASNQGYNQNSQQPGYYYNQVNPYQGQYNQQPNMQYNQEGNTQYNQQANTQYNQQANIYNGHTNPIPNHPQPNQNQWYNQNQGYNQNNRFHGNYQQQNQTAPPPPPPPPKTTSSIPPSPNQHHQQPPSNFKPPYNKQKYPNQHQSRPNFSPKPNQNQNQKKNMQRGSNQPPKKKEKRIRVRREELTEISSDGKKKKFVIKANCFTTPYNMKWPSMKKFHTQAILDELQSTFSSKLCDQFLLKKKLKIKSRRPDDTSEEINEILHDVAGKYKAYEKKDIDEMIKTLDRTDLIQYPSEYILFGINSITRHLEKAGDLELLMVCQSTNPKLMTHHLLCQSIIDHIPACSINGLSECLKNIFDMKSVLAIGFKKMEDNPFQDLVDFIKDKIPNQIMAKNNILKVLTNDILTEVKENIETLENQLKIPGSDVEVPDETLKPEKELEGTTKQIELKEKVQKKELKETVRQKELEVTSKQNKRKLNSALFEAKVNLVSQKYRKRAKKQREKKEIVLI